MTGFSVEKIYENIKKAAHKRGLNLGDVEKSVGTYQGYCSCRLRQVENQDYSTGAGRNNINMEIIWRFSKALGVTINDLIEGDF